VPWASTSIEVLQSDDKIQLGTCAMAISDQQNFCNPLTITTLQTQSLQICIHCNRLKTSDVPVLLFLKSRRSSMRGIDNVISAKTAQSPASMQHATCQQQVNKVVSQLT